MSIVENRKIFFTLSALLVLGSLWAWFFIKPSIGIDFTGGSLLEVSYESERPTLEQVRAELDKLDLGQYSLRPSGDNNYVLRVKEISAEEKSFVLGALSLNNSLNLSEERFNNVGPVVGESLQRKSIWALAVVVIGIVLFITFAFRKVSEPVSSWKYGLVTVLALAHDIIIPAGAYVIYGEFFSAEIDLLFVTALLAILGYSVHDTIVVFDRIREHLRNNQELNRKEEFEKTVDDSVLQTMGRSINTSLTLFLVLVALYFFGGTATQSFTFLLLVGVVVGAYSSIFFGAPLLVTLEKLQKKN